MREHGLIFKDWGIRAMLAGRKKQTRRPVKWSNSYVYGSNTEWWREHWPLLDFRKAWVDPGPSPAGNMGPYLKVPCPERDMVLRIYPRYQVGDLIWAKETWAEDDGRILYKATDHLACGHPWKSAMFMPKRVARYWGRIKAVRGQRVQDISEADAIAEGIDTICVRRNGAKATTAFAEAWDSIYYDKPDRHFSWAENPWVWPTTFERVDHYGQ